MSLETVMQEMTASLLVLTKAVDKGMAWKHIEGMPGGVEAACDDFTVMCLKWTSDEYTGFSGTAAFKKAGVLVLPPDLAEAFWNKALSSLS